MPTALLDAIQPVPLTVRVVPTRLSLGIEGHGPVREGDAGHSGPPLGVDDLQLIGARRRGRGLDGNHHRSATQLPPLLMSIWIAAVDFIPIQRSERCSADEEFGCCLRVNRLLSRLIICRLARFTT